MLGRKHGYVGFIIRALEKGGGEWGEWGALYAYSALGDRPNRELVAIAFAACAASVLLPAAVSAQACDGCASQPRQTSYGRAGARADGWMSADMGGVPHSLALPSSSATPFRTYANSGAH